MGRGSWRYRVPSKAWPMRGFYTIRGDFGEVTVENLITSKGRALILAYLSGDLVFWGDELAVGVSNVAPALGDVRMGYELGRTFVDVTESDSVANTVLLKGTIPREVIGNIYEIGLFSSAEKTGAVVPPAPLSDFDPMYMDVTNLTADTTNSRIGEGGSRLTAAVSTTAVGSINNLRIALEGRAPEDEFTLAYHNYGNAASVEVRFYTSATTYYTHTFTPLLGYNFYTWTKANFTTTTAANWIDYVTQIEFRVTANATAEASVTFDGIKAETPLSDPGYGLVSRSVLATPINKGFDSELEVEYTVQFGW